MKYFRFLGLVFLFILGFAATSWAISSQDLAVFQKANEDYRQGKYSDAIKGYEELSLKYPHTTAFIYDLGASYFKANNLSQAILAFEKARLLDPRNGDVLTNLKHANGLLEYRIEDKRNDFHRMAEKVLGFFTEKEIYFVALFFYALLLSSWAAVLFLHRGSFWVWYNKIFFTLTVIFMLISAAKFVETGVVRDAIVIVREAEVRYGPSESDHVAFRLKGGLKVFVVDKREGWSRVILTNGEGGWMKNDQIGEVRV